MDSVMSNYNTSAVLLFTIPVCWGIYEIRKLNKLLESYKTTVDALTPKVISTTTMMDNITKEQLEEYPFVEKIKQLIEKSNRILH
jgi:hypothetical protein|tara:strand:+ start:7468 stop:7722 length:255 start_codon:yes stop_codon:yes gene_type:complete